MEDEIQNCGNSEPYEYGKWLADPKPGEEVVISGRNSKINCHKLLDNVTKIPKT